MERKPYGILNEHKICYVVAEYDDPPKNSVELPVCDSDYYLGRKFNDGEWSTEKFNQGGEIPITVDDFKKIKKVQLNDKCRNAIEAGFSLFGHSFLYRESPDQNNMNTAAIGIMAGAMGITDPITEIEWETEDAGKVVFTATEFLQIFGYAEKIHKNPLLDKVFALKAEVEAATTMEEVAAVVW